jgi:putative two-component system response regulator
VTRRSAPRDPPLLLLIEDNRDTLVAAGRLFQTLGFAVEIGRGGAAGIEKAKSDRPDVIVTDIVMPETSGCDVCERLHADPATRSIPIIVYTGLTDIRTLASLARVGVRVFAIKPCWPQVIADEARALMAAPIPPNTIRVVADDGRELDEFARQIEAEAF